MGIGSRPCSQRSIRAFDQSAGETISVTLSIEIHRIAQSYLELANLVNGRSTVVIVANEEIQRPSVAP